MDPNVTLKLIREYSSNGSHQAALILFHELDEWLSRGGFLPDAWMLEGRILTDHNQGE